MIRPHLSKEEKVQIYSKKRVHVVLSNSYTVYLFSIMIAVILDFFYPIHFLNNRYINIGFVFMMLGSILVYWAQSSASRSKREMIEKKCERNFAVGPYKFSRRPTQLGLTFATLGFGLISESFFIIIAVIVSYFITRFIFLPRQERILMERYGDAYCDYRDKVKSII